MSTKPKQTKPKKAQVKVRDIAPKKQPKGGLRRTSDPCEGGE